MNSDFQSSLRCPDCGQSLIFLERPHSFSCSACDNLYPIRNGIPRFIADEHLASFGRQWTTYEVAHDEEDRNTFVAKTGFQLEELTGKLVLDAGCGGGRYSKIVAETGGIVVGADHTQAVDKASELCHLHRENTDFVQADLKHLPFPEEFFDFVFSIGVMHHDVDTKSVFGAVAKMVKPGGRYAVWLYRKNQWWQEWLNDFVRKRTVKMNSEKLERWCKLGATLGGIPFANKTLNKILNFSSHPNRENRICDTFDWYAPKYQHHHAEAELVAWFEEAGFEEIAILPPEKSGRFYRWCYQRNLLIGSGVNAVGIRRAS